MITVRHRVACPARPTPSGLHLRMLPALALVSVAVLANGRARAQPAVPRYERSDCAFEGAAELQGKVECGALVVAENRGASDGRSIRISVAVLKSSAPTRKPDAIVYLSGGPGGSGIAGAEGWLGRPFVRERDLVLVDQRGTGSSGALCPDAGKAVLQLMAKDGSAADDVAGNVAIARRCRESLRQRGVDPTRYGSAATAADLDELRAALGYAEWNLLGISYGTRLALTALRDRPGAIRSVVLDSAFPPAEDFYLSLSQSFGPALGRLAADCAAAPSCQRAGGELQAELAALETALAAHPLALGVDDPQNLPDGTFVMNPQDLRFIVGEQLVFGASRAVLPALLRAWRAGSTESLGTLVRASAQILGGHDLGKYYAVQCFEEMPFSKAPPSAPGPATAFHGAARAVCDDWQLPSADVRENEPVRADTPALLLAGELDPRAPPEWARRAGAQLAHGVLVEVPGAGHGTLGEGCVGELVAAFFDDPGRAPDATYIARNRALEPLGAVRLTAGPVTLLRAVRHGELGAPLWLGASLLVLLSAALVWPVRTLWRWRRRKGDAPAPASAGTKRSRRLKAAAHGLAWLAAVVAWAFVVGVLRATLALFSGPYALAIIAGLPADGAGLFALPKILVVAIAASLASAALGWRRGGWSRFERWHFGLTLGATVALAAFLVRYQLL